MEKIKVNMSPNPLDVQTIHASQNDSEAREWGFELHNNGEKIDSSSISDQLVFKSYKGGTEQILPENGAVPVTAPFVGDIKYPDATRTDQEFLYRQSPTEEDGLAKITDIKGNTLVWNQLAQLNQGVVNTCSKSYDDATAIMTITPTSYESNNVGLWNLVTTSNLKNGHKYYISIEVKPDFDVSVTFGFGPNVITGSLTSGKFQSVRSILTWTASSLTIYARLSESGWSSGTFQIKNVQCIDLTQMGLDITDPSDFTSLFPLSYYSYNSGSLLSFSGTGIKTTSKNFVTNFQVDNTTPNISWTQENGVIHSFGLSNGTTRTPTYTYAIPLKKGSYIISGCDGGSENTYGLRVQKLVNGTWVSVLIIYDGEDTFTLDEDAEVRVAGRFSNRQTANYDVTFYPMIRYADAPSGFEPYTESTLSLPISSYFPTGMKSAGSVYDELTNSKAITRVGSRAYQSGDESDTSVITDGTTTYYALATPTETSFTTASLVTENAEIPLSNEDGVLIGKCTEQLSENPGFIDAKIKLTDSDGTCYSNKLQLHVERSPQ